MTFFGIKTNASKADKMPRQELCQRFCQGLWRARLVRGGLLVLPLVVCVLIPAYAKSAWHGLGHAEKIHASMAQTISLSPSVVNEQCRPLLRSSGRSDSPAPSPALSSSPRDERSTTDGPRLSSRTAAAHASTLSLILGVRFALGPLEDTAVGSHAHRVMAEHVNLLEPGSEMLVKNETRLQLHQNNQYNALRVLAFRECVKRETLRLAVNRP
jgi:hypothetical protein